MNCLGTIVTAFSLVLWPVLVGAQTSGAAAQGATLFQVNNKKIGVNEFLTKYNMIKEQTIAPPSKAMFLEDLIRFEVGVQEALKQGTDQLPEFKERMRQEMYKIFIEKAIRSQVEKIKVTEREQRNYYRQNPELRTSHILIQYPPQGTSEQKAIAIKRANEIRSEVVAKLKSDPKSSFEKLVPLYTDDLLTKGTGGDLGYQSSVSLVPTYYRAALKLKVGQISHVVPSRHGFHIIKLLGRRSYAQADKRQIKAAVFDTKRKKIFDRYFERLKKQYKIVAQPELLR